jgi:hypothetical protein
MVLEGIEGAEICEVVDDIVNTYMSIFIWRRAMEGVYADVGADMGRLEVLGDGLDGVLLKHTSGVLLACL